MTYYINSSDQNTNREISINSNTFSGPTNPFTAIPAIGATSTELSISLYGKDQVNYGEKIQENLVYLLENFSGITEPTFAVNGQLWFDRSNSPNSLKIFNTQKHPITAATLTLTELVIEFSATASDVNRFQAMLDNSNNRFRIFSNDPVYTPNAPPVTYERSKVIEFTVLDSFSTPGVIKLTLPLTPPGHYIHPTLNSPTPDNNFVGWYVGGWESIVQCNTTGGDIDMQGFKVINLADATNPLDAINYQTLQTYVASQVTSNSLAGLTDVTLTSLADSDILLYNTLSSKWINIPLSVASGSIPTTISGLTNDDILIYDSGTSTWRNVPPSAHPKIVTATLTGIQNNDILTYDTGVNEFVNVSISNHPAGIITAQVTGISDGDTLIYDISLAAWKNTSQSYLLTAGGIMTGSINMNNNFITNVIDPVNPQDVATKQYIDSAVSTGGITGGSYDISTGDLVLNGASSVIISADPLLATVRDISTIPLNRVILAADGINSVYNFGDVDSTFKYIVGHNKLSIFQNGVKSYMDTNGYLIIDTKKSQTPSGIPLYDIINTNPSNNEFIISGNHASVFPAGLKISVNVNSINNDGYYIVDTLGATDVGLDTIIPVTSTVTDISTIGFIYLSDILTNTTATGLSLATTYEFQLDVNGSGLVTYSLLGSDAQSISSLILTINTLIYPNAQVTLIDHKLKFVSMLSGATSSITVIDGNVNPLFAALIGDTTSIINIDDLPNFSTSSSIVGTSYEYFEVGNIGTVSSTITFNTPPTAGIIIEALANYIFVS